MRRTLPIVGIFIGILILGMIAYIGNTQLIIGNNKIDSNPIGVDVAKGNIEKFAGQQYTQINFTDNLTAPDGKYYELSTDDGTYFVNMNTGDVEAVSYHSEQNIGQNSVISLTRDLAESKAMAFASEHYKNFSTMDNLSLVQSNLIDHGTAGKEYQFVWGQKINGIFTPNTVQVSVDAATGNVTSYVGIERPIEVNLVSKITKDQATNIAIGQFKNITVVKANASLGVVYKNDGSQAVAWAVDITGQPVNRIIPGGEVTIDANNGEIIGIDPYL